MIVSSPNPKPVVPSRNYALPDVFVHGIGTAVASNQTPQDKTLEFVLSNFKIEERTRQLYKKALLNDSIRQRHFALDNLDQVTKENLDEKNRRFQLAAVAMA